MLLRFVLPSEVEIALSIAGEVLNIENQLVLMVRFNDTFNNISVYCSSFIGGGNRSTVRKPLTNFIRIRNHDLNGDLH